MKNKLFLLAVSAFVLMMGFSACDPCKDVTCLNGGVCDEGDCLCVGDYEGDDCGTHKIAKFTGDFTVTPDCGSGQGSQFDCTITEDEDVTNGIIFSNFFNLVGFGAPADQVVKGTVNLETNVITIPTQTVAAVVFDATSGTLDGTTFSLTYTSDDNGIVRTCTDVYTKN